jgi:hypothetical protein
LTKEIITTKIRTSTGRITSEGAPSYYLSYQSDPSFVGGQPSTQHDGNSSFVGGQPSTHDGNSSFVGGHRSTQDGDSSFVGGRPSTHDGDSSFVGGHPSAQESTRSRGNSSFVGGRPLEDESFVGGQATTQTTNSAPGVPANPRGQNSFNSSVDQSISGLQVESITAKISEETEDKVGGFAATLRILAELARQEQRFTAGQRFAWRFITLAEAPEAGGNRSSAALRGAGEPTQNRVFVEAHGMLGGRSANIG